MNTKRIFITLSSAALMLLTLAIQTGAHADDIDIYLNPVINTVDQPVVMFTLDYRANLGATVCNGTTCDFLVYKDWKGEKEEYRTYEDADGHKQRYLVLDAGGTTSYFNLLRGALKFVLQEVGPSGVKIGLAINHDQGGGRSCTGVQSGSSKCTNGGYIVQGAGALNTQALRDAFFAKLDAMPTPGGTVNHPYQGKELFFELFRYFSGQGWFNMKNGWEDRKTNGTYNVDQAGDYTPANAAVPLSWDSSIVSGANYISPVVAGCAKLYTINILFQVSQQEDDSDTAIKTGAGSMTGINLTGANNNFATVIRWMYDNDNNTSIANKQNVTSYFIVDPTKTNVTTRSYAGAGQGVASLEPYVLSEDPQVLIETFKAIFKNILSTSTTFVAPTVAVNVYNRAQVQDEVYIAMFQAPDPYHPRWPGNLKKYKIASINNGADRQIQDVNGQFAVDPSKGRIRAEALSFWTHAADLPKAARDEVEFVDTKDGRGVDRGGAGSKIPGAKLKCDTSNLTDPLCHPGDYSPGLTNPSGATTNITARKVFYDQPDGTLGALNADTATATALQSTLDSTSIGTCNSTDADATSACNLLTYARGGVYVSVDGSTALRGQQWLLGDLLHSRPIAVNYGARGGYTEAKPDVRIIAGSNEGLMHMFRNLKIEQDPAVPNELDGVETWAFMPRQVMPTLKTLKADVNPTTPPHPYTVDGSPAVFIKDVNGNGNIESGDKVWLFFGLRRGGNTYYAMDITDPDAPTLKWTITGGTGDFAELGQTWSTPQIGYMLFDGSTDPKPVLIFGGGYSTNKDTHVGHNDAGGVPITSTQVGSDDSIGNAVFIVNADTGALVWKAVYGATYAATSSKVFHHPDLKDSIPSEITAVDTGGNGLIDRLYFGDTGGRLWRADLACKNQDGTGCSSTCKLTDGTTDCTNGWKVTPILSVGRHNFLGLANDRRFFYPPDFAQSKDKVCVNADGTLSAEGTVKADGTVCEASSEPFDAIIIGTGDRETPKELAVKNWFYMFKDRDTATSSIPDDFVMVLHSDSQLGDVSSDCLQLGTCGASPPDLTKGWKMRLHCQQSTIDNSCGEKNLSSALTLGGTIFFTTYIPAGGVPTACSLPEGNGFFYAVSLQQGLAVEDFYSGNGTTLDKQDRATTLTSGGIPAEVVSLGGDKLLRPDLQIDDVKVRSGYKTFWYEKYLK